ncbi:hypothetical protein [Belnapia moabensis]|uniref:hypothetical protein n=1 Tax=Belnapia moabensis TaxID=365533 RepID=UPI0012ED5DB4|nr:hypothetical protein [Belnapia moabensis]
MTTPNPAHAEPRGNALLAALGERLRMPHARRGVASRRPHAAERRIACTLGIVVEGLSGRMVRREVLQASLEALLGGLPRETVI